MAYVNPCSYNHLRVQFVSKTERLTCSHHKDYLEALPEGKPKGTIVLIHGFPDMSLGWRYQIPHFVKLGYRTIALDCMGYGKTVCSTNIDLPHPSNNANIGDTIRATPQTSQTTASSPTPTPSPPSPATSASPSSSSAATTGAAPPSTASRNGTPLSSRPSSPSPRRTAPRPKRSHLRRLWRRANCRISGISCSWVVRMV